MQKRISYFDVDWDRARKTGGIWLTFDDRSRIDLRPIELDELSLLCNLLRSEKTVYYDDESQTLSTQPAMVRDRDA